MYQKYLVEMENGNTFVREEGQPIEEGSPWIVQVMAVRGSFCIVCIEDKETGRLGKEKINEAFAVRVMSTNNQKGMKDYPMNIRKHMDLFTQQEKNLIKQKRTYPDGSTYNDPTPNAERANKVFGSMSVTDKKESNERTAPDTKF